MSTHSDHLVESTDGILDVIRETRTIAVLGIKPEIKSGQPAFYVPQYMQSAGYKIIPVPVYFPEIEQILGERVFRAVSEVETPIDMVNVFRRPHDIPPHVDDIIAARPKSVWFQLGIRNDESAQRLAAAGIKVVQNRCLMVEHRRL
ncbi:MAG: CoA-binding protein [Acidobacteria bacterium]|nr:CoA-binding protein [Acidobacteriota bacterium]